MTYVFDLNDGISLGGGSDLNPNGNGSAMSIAAWVAVGSNASNKSIVCRTDGAGTTVYHFFAAPAGGWRVTFGVNASGPVQGGTGISDNVLFHAGATILDDDAIVYTNGAADGSGTMEDLPAITGNTTIGYADTTVPGTFYEGTIAEVGIWNVQLTADEMARLARRVSPELVRRESLISYVKLNSALIDRVRPVLPAVSQGAPVVSSHLRMVYASMPKSLISTAAAAPPPSSEFGGHVIGGGFHSHIIGGP